MCIINESVLDWTCCIEEAQNPGCSAKQMVLLSTFSYVYTVSVACSCSQSKKGKRNIAWSTPGRRERMALFLLVRAFLAQLHQSGSQSMGFLSGTAVFQVYGWPPFQTRTSLRSGAGAATSTWKPPHPPQSSAPCQEFPLAVCRDSWGRAEWLLGWG